MRGALYRKGAFKLNKVVLLGFFFVAMAVCGVFRVMLSLTYIDAATGFYVAGADTLSMAFAIAMAAVVAILLFFPHSGTLVKHRPVTGVYYRVFGLLLGAVMTAYSVATFYTYPSTDVLIVLPQWLLIAEAGLALAGGVGLLLVYCTPLHRQTASFFAGLFVAILPVWAGVFTVVTFSRMKQIVTHSANLLTVCFMLLFVLFAIHVTKIISGVRSRRSVTRALRYGMATAFVGVVHTVTEGIALLSVEEALGLADTLKVGLLFAMALYALGAVLSMLNSYVPITTNVPTAAPHTDGATAENAPQPQPTAPTVPPVSPSEQVTPQPETPEQTAPTTADTAPTDSTPE